jgi:hypothetical protein
MEKRITKICSFVFQLNCEKYKIMRNMIVKKTSNNENISQKPLGPAKNVTYNRDSL